MEEGQLEILAQVVEITGLHEDAAINLLQATDWNPEQAVTLHFAGGVHDAPARPSAQPGAASPTASPHQMVDEDDVRAPLPAKMDRLYGDASMAPSRSGMAYQRAMGTQGSASRPQKPVEVFRDLKAEAADGGGKGGSALADMFKPPQELVYQGNLNAAKDVAQQEGRWMMINVQSSSEFASHQLNRDTFTHEAVKAAISGMFLFIQLQGDSPEGQQAQTSYRIHQLPVIMILDPITGALLYSRSGFVAAEKLLEDLVPFMDHRPQDPGGAQLAQRMTLKRKQAELTPGSSGAAAGVAGQGAGRGGKGLTEDEELARAIALSMDPAGGYSGGDDSDGDNDGSNGDDDDAELQSMIAAVAAAGAGAAGTSSGPAATNTATNTATITATTAAAPALPPPEQVQSEAQARLPAEPAEGAPGSCRVAVRLPTGERFQRRFAETDTVQALHDLVLSNSTDAASGKKFIIGLAAPGGVVLDQPEQSLKDAGVANAMLAVKWTD